jgi:membrane protease YdiL (CAAX protease family)
MATVELSPGTAERPPVAERPPEAPAPVQQRPATAEWSPRLAVVAVTAGVLIGLAAAFGVSALMGEDDALGLGIGFLVADALMLSIVLFAATRGNHRIGPATFAFRRTELAPAVGWALAIWLGASGVIGIAAAIFGEGDEGGGSSLTNDGTLAVFLIVFGVTVTAPIVEEVTFRGYLFAALTRWRGPWPAALLSGALFGAAHFLALPPQFLVPIGVLGLGLCFVFWVTRSILPCIGIHALNNGLVMSIALGWTWQVPLVTLGAPLVALLLVAPFFYANRQPNEQGRT